MINPRDYWEEGFKNLKLQVYDFSKYGPAICLVKFCDNYLGSGSSILDLGCGAGRNAYYLSQRGYKVYGLDIAHSGLSFSKKLFNRLGLDGIFVQGSFDTIPFCNHCFSGIICIAALDHALYNTARLAMSEMRRVLKPNGVILLTFDPEDTDEDILDEAKVLSDGTLEFFKGKQKGLIFHRYKDLEINELVGEENIISFERTEKGTRIVICR